MRRRFGPLKTEDDDGNVEGEVHRRYAKEWANAFTEGKHWYKMDQESLTVFMKVLSEPIDGTRAAIPSHMVDRARSALGGDSDE